MHNTDNLRSVSSPFMYAELQPSDQKDDVYICKHIFEL